MNPMHTLIHEKQEEYLPPLNSQMIDIDSDHQNNDLDKRFSHNIHMI